MLDIEDLSKMNDRQLYDRIIQAQETLIEKRATVKMELENKEDFGPRYYAIVNEINTLKKELNALKLFRKDI